LFKAVIIFAAMVAASHALATDADNGKRLAESHCAPCHKIMPDLRDEVADAPPFDLIGRKHRFDANAIASTIAGPHPKMNFSPQRNEAADIAAYIGTLGK